MLSLMDQAPCLRWCVDFDAVGLGDREKEFFLRLVDGCDLLVIVGWWTVTSPKAIENGIAALRRPEAVLYHGNRPLGVRNVPLAELIEMLQMRECRPQPAGLTVAIPARIADLASW
ncbi:MAG TPA: hypothetical protein VG871_05150 [Vicinamibacterales bacterium]|nr:hypothetical protein [Vicinamibacterales bacterium]